MNLDKHFNILPLNCFTVNLGKRFVKRQGYFSNDIDNFSNHRLCGHGTLECIYHDAKDPFEMKECGSRFKYFYPDALLNNVPKLRPYKTFDEIPFVNLIIKIRKKGSEIYGLRMAMGFNVDSDSILTSIMFYGKEITMQDLFDNYEWQQGYEISDADEWKTFGVEENGV